MGRKELWRLCRQGAGINAALGLVIFALGFNALLPHGLALTIAAFIGCVALGAITGAIHWPIAVFIYRALASIFRSSSSN